MKTYYQAQTKLKPAQFMLYSAIFTTIQYTGKDFIMTDSELADKYEGLSERSITRHLPELVAEGYITLSKGQKINLNGQITILNDGAYRTISTTATIKPTKNAKKKVELNWEEDEKFISFYNRYRDSSLKVGSRIGANKKTAYKLYVKIKDKEELFANTNEYARQMIDTNTYMKGITAWLNNTHQHWINDDYVVRPVKVNVHEENFKRMREDYIELKMLYSQAGEAIDLKALENKMMRYYKSNTYNKVNKEIKRLQDKLGQVK
tara:strand:- start:1219 stop:2007 length:789 start_codon:yes stop_codon:yes gene_type:complete